MLKAVKYRLYPTEQQNNWFSRNFGCCRKVYNECLHFRKDAYSIGGINMTTNDTIKTLPKLKAFYDYLKEADSASLQQALRNLGTAYDNFFAGRTDFPKHKSRKSRQSYTTPMSHGNIKVLNDAVVLPKVGRVKAVVHRRFDGIIKSATISKNHCDQYFCSVLYEMPDEPINHVINTDNSVGFDYKSDGLFVSSDGEVCGSPKYYRLMEHRLSRAERRLSRKHGPRKGEQKSRNFEKQRLRIAKIHLKIANQRYDFLHKKSHDLAERYDLVCVEDLDMKAISNRSFRNGKATLDNGYGIFVAMLSYKLADRGKRLIKVDKWFPSSQLCHNCGTKNPITKDLSIRKVVCPVCGAVYDRDLNAALNIRDEGIRLYKSA